MRIRRVLLCCHNGARIADKPLVVEPRGHLLLHRKFGHRLGIAHALRHELERAILYAMKGRRRFAVRFQCVCVPDRFEPLHQITGRGHVDPASPHELQRAAIDPRDIGNRAVARILHRHPRHAAQQLRQSFIELLTAGVYRLFPGKRIERSALDCVDQPSRLTCCGNQIEPAARRHFRAACRSQQARRDGIRAVKIVKEPPVEPLGFQRLLDRGNVKRHEKSV